MRENLEKYKTMSVLSLLIEGAEDKGIAPGEYDVMLIASKKNPDGAISLDVEFLNGGIEGKQTNFLVR